MYFFRHPAVGILGTLLIANTALAQQLVLPTLPSNIQTIAVATVNITNATITDQKENLFTISFDISNREGSQPQVKYGVELIKEGSYGQARADEKIYDETLNLAANSKEHRTITYQAPQGLTGEYSLFLSSKNTSGFPLAFAFVKKVTLNSTNTLGTVEVLPESCFLRVSGEADSLHYTPLQGVDISSTEYLTAECTAINNTNNQLSLTPHYETYYRSAYGDKVAHQGGSRDIITFKPRESKSFLVTLPKATKPQAYDVKLFLEEAGLPSNTVTFHYVLRGASATIQNIVLDKNSYQAGDTARLSFMWSPSADNFSGSRAGTGTGISSVSLTVTITGVDQKNCAAPQNQDLSPVLNDPRTIISIPITNVCENPRASITLRDSQGNILAEENFVFGKEEVSPVAERDDSTPAVIIVIVLLAALLIATLFYKKNETPLQ